MTGNHIDSILRYTNKYKEIINNKLKTNNVITEKELDNFIILSNSNNHKIEYKEIPFGKDFRYTFRVNDASYRGKISDWRNEYYMKINLIKYLLNH